MRTRARAVALIAALGLAMGAGPVAAQEIWDDLRTELYGKRVPVAAPERITLEMPYRTMTDPRTPLGARVVLPVGETIRTVSLIIDDNPMPVSAVFDLAEPVRRFAFTASMRLNGPSPVRVVVETREGPLYMAETLVKTSGVGACSAPPGTDPALALESMGRMTLSLAGGADSLMSRLVRAGSAQIVAPSRTAELAIDHPSHSGMQMDQISLLFIPARYIETVSVAADDTPLFSLTGSISLSENPVIGFEIPDGAIGLDVEMQDTKGARFLRSFSLDGG